MTNEEMEKLFQEPEFINSLMNAKTAENIQAICKEKGLDLTDAEVNDVVDCLKAVKTGELSDDDLENVSGGWVDQIGSMLIKMLEKQLRNKLFK